MFKIQYAVINDRMPEDFEDSIVFADGEYEMMMFGVPVLIEVDGEMKEYPRRTAIIYKPGQHVHYKAANGELLYSWIRFDCDDLLFSEGYIPYGEPIFCDNYDYFLKYWEMIANENFWQRQSQQYNIDNLMNIIFHWLHDYAYPSDSSRYQILLENLRNDIYAHPEYDWNLDYMAKRVNMSTRFLQKIYKDFAHMSCIGEVIESRMRKAKMLLSQTDEPINKISEECGYKNVEHFCRQFKKHEGCSPSMHRKSHKK